VSQLDDGVREREDADDDDDDDDDDAKERHCDDRLTCA
jgi:hypothetical protein